MHFMIKHFIKSLYCLLIVAVILPIAACADSTSGNAASTSPAVSSWAQDEVQKARELGLVPSSWCQDDFRTPITREDFRILAMQFVAVQEHYDLYDLNLMVDRYLADKDTSGDYQNGFSDNISLDDTLAYYLGVVQGRGNGIFDPSGLITRQEAAAMITRAYGVCGGTLPTDTAKTNFTDEDNISDWAKDSVSALASWNVMDGMEDGSFSPEQQCTAEQCVIMFLRLYENAPVSRKNGNVTPLFTYKQGLQYIEKRSSFYKESLKIEYSEATLIRTNIVGVMRPSSSLSFVYPNGGVKSLVLGIFDQAWGFSPSLLLEDPHFSDDGKTFYCSVTIPNDVYNMDKKLATEKGIYHFTVDVDTCTVQSQREDL
jgi:hypothetical protein